MRPELLWIAALPAALLIASSPTDAAVRVIDGDTIDLDGERIRLTSEAGPMDAPELFHPGCPKERATAMTARDRLTGILALGKITVERQGFDWRGRTIAIVRADGRDVSAILERDGLAAPWPRLSRRDKPDWCRP